jgi:hypothetical protein
MIVVEQRCGGAMAEPEAVDGLERHAAIQCGLAKPHAELFLGARCQRVAAGGLAGFGTAKLEHAPAGRLVAEVVIEGHRAIDLGAGKIERFGHHGGWRLQARSRRRAAAHAK